MIIKILHKPVGLKKIKDNPQNLQKLKNLKANMLQDTQQIKRVILTKIKKLRKEIKVNYFLKKI